jgi:hypothetical protein
MGQMAEKNGVKREMDKERMTCRYQKFFMSYRYDRHNNTGSWWGEGRQREAEEIQRIKRNLA